MRDNTEKEGNKKQVENQKKPPKTASFPSIQFWLWINFCFVALLSGPSMFYSGGETFEGALMSVRAWQVKVRTSGLSRLPKLNSERFSHLRALE